MNTADIPKEIPELVERIRQLKKQENSTFMRGFDPQRAELLASLRKIKDPSDTESKLIAELSAKNEQHLSEHSTNVDACRAERAPLYEKLRVLYRDLFLGKYVLHITSESVSYIRVSKVCINPNDGGTVVISGESIVFHVGDFPSTYTRTLKVLNLCLPFPPEKQMETLEIVTRKQLLDALDAFRKTMETKYWSLLDFADTMEKTPLPQDEPANPANWF